MANVSTKVDLDVLALNGKQEENVQSSGAPEEGDTVRTEGYHHGTVSLASGFILYYRRRALTRLNLHVETGGSA